MQTGKVYRNLMVDVQPTNAKLADRSNRIVAATGGNAKTAIAMLLAHCTAEQAQERLAHHDGWVRPAVGR